ncbi:MAG: M56 family metallopeptidase [Aristaeellaceae bacterium]
MRTATVFNFLVEATLIGSALIVLTLVLRAPVRRRAGGRLLMLLWVLVAMRLLLPIALPNPVMNWLKPFYSQDPGIRPMADQVRVRVGDAAHELYYKVLGDDPTPTPVHTFLWRMVYATRNGRLSRAALTVYVSGAALCGLWMLAQHGLFLRQLRRRKRRRLTPEEAALLDMLCQRHGVKHQPRVWVTEGLPGSSSFDVMRPVIVLPAQADAADMAAMMAREVCHIRRHDALWGLVRNGCCVVHWFNPLVWIGAWCARADMCMATDAYALAGQGEQARRAYAQPLIHTADTHRAWPALTIAATPMALRDGQMAQRIRAILHPEEPQRVWRGMFAVCCTVTLMMMFATAEQSSLANLPTLISPALRQEPVTLDTPEAAESYARAFLALEGIEAEEDFISPTLSKNESGWVATWYAPGAAMASELSFTETGALLGYMDGSLLPGELQPLPTPITLHSGEGQQWCAFLSAFLQTHLPEIWQDYDAMEIVSSGRRDGEYFLTIGLLGEVEWQAVVMISPQGRLVSLLPVVG